MKGIFHLSLSIRGGLANAEATLWRNDDGM